MVVKQPLFQQNDTADQTADIFRLWLRDVVNEHAGIMQETSFEVIQRGAGANNSVDVRAGGIIIPGSQAALQGNYYVVNDATVNVPMSTAAHASLPRIDTVLVEVRDAFYSGVNNDARIVYQAGTAAGSPVAPDLDTLGYENYWRLANINVPANDNTIVTGDITDLRTSPTISPAQGRATGVGGIITCTSTTRPSNPRKGQWIWESNTKKVLVNEGTSSSPTWVAYASTNSGIGPWTNYVPTFTGLVFGGGTPTTTYGRYFRYSTLVVGVAGFKLGSAGNVDTGITVTLPSAPSTAGGTSVSYIGAARGYDASTGFQWAATAEIGPALGALMFNIATAGQLPWNATIPFNWAPNDVFQCLFLYEVVE